MKAKKFLATVMAVTFVMALGFAAYAMGPGDNAETGNSSTSNQHHSDTITCPYMSSHMGYQMGSQMGPGQHMENHMDADNTGMMGRHLKSGAHMMNHDHSSESTDGQHPVQ